MKHIFAVILSVLLLTACGESERVQFEKLKQVDSIAEVNADSALTMLTEINRDTLLGNNNKYYFDLLQIRANDKAYITHTSDSAILSVIEYFENNDFNNLLPVAYYYGGRVYSDLGDAPQALEYFHKALDCENINAHTEAVTYSQIASLYHEQKVYDLAIPAYKKAIELSNANNNITNVIYNTNGIASIYYKEEKIDSALFVFNQSIIRAEKLGLSKLISTTKLEIAEIYILKKDYNKALSILNSTKNQFPKEDSAIVANIFAHLYYRLGNTDSTIFYCDKLIKCKNPRSRKNGYNILANLSLKNNNIIKAVNPMIESQLLDDTITNIETPQEIRQLSSIYNYQIRERENNKLKQEAQENEIKIICLVSSLVIIFIISIFVFHIIRKRKHIIKLKLRNVELLLKKSNEFSESTIAENNKQIAQLESKISSINSENQSLIQELKIQKKLLELNNEKAIIYNSQKDNAILIFNNDTFVKEIRHRLKIHTEEKNILSEKEWNTLIDKINFLFPAFIDTLQNLPFKISVYEFRISILIKTKFTPKEIARLTNHSESSVSITRIRLYKKLTNIDGHTIDWDNFVNSI